MPLNLNFMIKCVAVFVKFIVILFEYTYFDSAKSGESRVSPGAYTAMAFSDSEKILLSSELVTAFI